MSRWKTSFDAQHTDQHIQGCLTLLDGISIEGLTEQDLTEFSRLLKVLKVLRSLLSRLDPELLTLSASTSFSAWLAEVHSHIDNFRQRQGISNLHAANATIDQILNLLQPLDSSLTVEEFKAIAEANSVFQNRIVSELGRVTVRGKEVEAQLEALSNAIADGKSRLDENNIVIQTQKARLDQSIADFQKQFSDAQEKRNNDFADSTRNSSLELSVQEKRFETEFKDASEQRRNEFETVLKSIRAQSEENAVFLKGREAEVNRIFGAIGTTAFAGNFKTTADKEARAADIWRRVALGCMAAMIGVGGYAFFFSIGHETDWRVFAFRLGTVLVLAVPAAYAGNESSRHRERERLNRKIHLELASIDAYLVLLPEEQKNKIKGELTEKFFGVPMFHEKSEDVSKKDMFGVLASVVNNLTKGK